MNHFRLWRICSRCGHRFSFHYHPERQMCMFCWTARHDRRQGVRQKRMRPRTSHASSGCLQANAVVPNLTFATRLNMGFALLHRAGDMEPEDFGRSW